MYRGVWTLNPLFCSVRRLWCDDELFGNRVYKALFAPLLRSYPSRIIMCARQVPRILNRRAMTTFHRPIGVARVFRLGVNGKPVSTYPLSKTENSSGLVHYFFGRGLKFTIKIKNKCKKCHFW